MFNPDLVRMLYDKATASGTPLGGTFELTPRCNMNCKMCYIRMTPDEMKKRGRERTVDEWLDMASQAKKEGMVFLLLTGGEPLLYPDFKKLYEELKKMGIIVSINTNAVLIDDKATEYFIKNRPNRLNITLYGGSDETYGRLCATPDGFTKATAAIKKLRAAGLNIKINSSITPENSDDIKSVFDFAREIGSPCSVGCYMFPPVRRDNGSTDRFDAVTAGLYQAKVDMLRYSDAEIKAKLDLISSADSGIVPSEQPIKFNCRAGRSSFWITWDGRMNSCGMMSDAYLDPFGDGFKACWDEIRKKTEETEVMLGCKGCADRAVCHICPAIAKAETGDLNGRPDYLCRMTQAWKKEMRRKNI